MPKKTKTTTTKASTKATKKVTIKKPSTAAATKKKATNSKVKEEKVMKAVSDQICSKINTDFWTKARQEEFEKCLRQIYSYKNQELKDILKANGQSRSGNKIDLLTKVVDGMMFGSIPDCPACGGGRPKLDLLNGTYYCKGYMDDDEWHYCKTVFKFDEIKRGEWTMNV